MGMWSSSRRKDPPFAVVADPRTVFDSASFRSAYLAVIDAIARRAGLILLVSEPGCGKTMLLRTVQDVLAQQRIPIFLRVGSCGDEEDLLAALLTAMNVTSVPAQRTARLHALNLCLARGPGSAIVLIDEADRLSDVQLVDLAELAEWRRGEPDSVQVVLAGWPQLMVRLRQLEPRRIAWHIATTIRLDPLSHQEVARYVVHHLAISRQRNVTFEAPALDRLSQLSQGIPRRINLLCACAMAGGIKRIDVERIDEAAFSCGLAFPEEAEPRAVSHLKSAPVTRAVSHRSRTEAQRPSTPGTARLAYGAAGVVGMIGLGLGGAHLLHSDPPADFRPPVHVVTALQPLTATVEGHDAAAAEHATPALSPPTDANPADGSPPGQTAPGAEPALEAVAERQTSFGRYIDEFPLSPPELRSAGEAPVSLTGNEPLLVEESAEAPQPMESAEIPSTPEDELSVAPQDTDRSSAEGGSLDPAAPDASPPEHAPEPSIEPAPSISPEPPAPQRTAPGTTASRPPMQLGRRLDAERLLAKGRTLMEEGDIASARLFFERAALEGHSGAMAAIGQTFDPLELRRLGTIGVKGDPTLALEWYRSAAAAGNSEAGERIARLTDWMRAQSAH